MVVSASARGPAAPSPPLVRDLQPLLAPLHAAFQAAGGRRSMARHGAPSGRVKETFASTLGKRRFIPAMRSGTGLTTGG